jgi:hypothetical protein
MNRFSVTARHARPLLVLGCLAIISLPGFAAESDFSLGVSAYKKKDYAQAAAYWSKSVLRGDAYAMNNLGYLYYYGYGVSKDHAAALGLWRVAAFAGNSESQWHLGKAFESGIGVEQSLAKAYAWYRCSVESASENVRSNRNVKTETEILDDSRDSLRELADKMDASELAMGEALASEYIARYGRVAP